MGNVNVVTQYNNDVISQRVEFDNMYEGVGISDPYTRVIQLRNEGAKESLSNLGYLSPDEADKAILLANLRGQTQALRSIREMVIGEWLEKKLTSEIMRVEHLIDKNGG